MAYGLRYTLTQKLRNESSLIVKIYEEGYTGSIKTYTPTKITLNPNSNEEDPVAAIISSQLEVSFIVETEDDYSQFPDLLNSNDKKYFVELINYNGTENLKWRGFIFNDYINLGFSTGIQEANFVCVDALSYLKYTKFSALEGNTNATASLLSVINTILNSIGYKSDDYPTAFYSCCSYYAEGMFDRGDASGNEPFNQTYQYRRDFVGVDYYTILENIAKSFGCRFFQYEGNWWMMAINEIAGAFNYYTKYIVGTVAGYNTSGVLDSTINIEPYSSGNIHFIDNSQVKIIRKGFSRLRVKSPYAFPDNYINNGDFKQTTGFTSAPLGFTSTISGTGSINVYDYPEEEYNDVRIQQNGSGVSLIVMTGDGVTPQYLPKMGDSSATLTFDYALYSTSGYSTLGKCALIVRLFVGSYTYYLNSSGKWVTSLPSSEEIIIADSGTSPTPTLRRPFKPYSLSIPLGISTADNVNDAIGYISIAFIVSQNNSLFRFNKLKLSQSSAQFSALQVQRQLGTNKELLKEIEVPYGADYPLLLVSNTLGSFFLSNGHKAENWYRYGKGSVYATLVGLLCRQYSNIFNKNMATLEADLGESIKDNKFVYLNSKFLVTDLTTNSLTYNNKVFMANRLTLQPYDNQVTSLQILEISDTDNESVETIKYLG